MTRSDYFWEMWNNKPGEGVFQLKYAMLFKRTYNYHIAQNYRSIVTYLAPSMICKSCCLAEWSDSNLGWFWLKDLPIGLYQIWVVDDITASAYDSIVVVYGLLERQNQLFLYILQGMCFCQYVLHREQIAAAAKSVVQQVKGQMHSMRRHTSIQTNLRGQDNYNIPAYHLHPSGMSDSSFSSRDHHRQASVTFMWHHRIRKIAE